MIDDTLYLSIKGHAAEICFEHQLHQASLVLKMRMVMFFTLAILGLLTSGGLANPLEGDPSLKKNLRFPQNTI